MQDVLEVTLRSGKKAAIRTLVPKLLELERKVGIRTATDKAI
jgi:hypothetical protein